MLNKVLIYFKFDTSQAFLPSADNPVHSVKLLGCIMKYDTSENDYPVVGNVLFSLFTKSLKSLWKSLLILFAESSSTFHSFYVCLIRSRILNLTYPSLSSGCI